MGVLDQPLRSAASAVLGTFGKTVTFWPNEQRKYDTATRKTLGPYADPINVRALVQDVTLYGGQAGGGQGGTAYGATGGETSGLMLTVAASDLGDLIPSNDWEVGLGELNADGTEKRHGVVRVESTYATDEIATYDITVRR